MTTFAMRRVGGEFVVTSPDIEPMMKFKTRREARDWCAEHYPGSPIRNPPNQQSSAAIGLLLTYSFDLRKKLELIQVILKRRDVEENKMFKRLHQLHDLRNVITHFPFEPDGDNRLSCDYINRYGGMMFSKKPAISDEDSSITYAEFDFYAALAKELYEKLYELWNSDVVWPITEDELRHAIEVEKAISSSDNVVRFPEKLQLDDED